MWSWPLLLEATLQAKVCKANIGRARTAVSKCHMQHIRFGEKIPEGLPARQKKTVQLVVKCKNELIILRLFRKTEMFFSRIDRLVRPYGGPLLLQFIIRGHHLGNLQIELKTNNGSKNKTSLALQAGHGGLGPSGKARDYHRQGLPPSSQCTLKQPALQFVLSPPPRLLLQPSFRTLPGCMTGRS